MHIFKLKTDPDNLIFLLLWVALENRSWLLALPTVYIYNTLKEFMKKEIAKYILKTLYVVSYICLNYLSGFALE